MTQFGGLSFSSLSLLRLLDSLATPLIKSYGKLFAKAGFPKLEKTFENLFVDAGANAFGEKVNALDKNDKKGISEVTCSGIRLTNNEATDEVIKYFEDTRTLLKGTTKKINS